MLSFRAKLRCKKLGRALLLVLAAALIFWLVWMIWLQRYLIFTREGVSFDFDRSTKLLENQELEPLPSEETISVHLIYDHDTDLEQQQGMTAIFGWYADTNMLLDGVAPVAQALAQVGPDSAVMLDVKSKFGNYYYSTSLSGAGTSDSIDITAMDQLIQDLSKTGCYLIARLPALRDSAFAEANQESGLALSSGALWTDEEKCYWLNPDSDTVHSNLVQICRELQKLGFDEVVFTDFRIPDSGSIVFQADATKDEVLKQAAKRLVSACASTEFTVSFQGGLDFPMPQGQSRLYLADVEAEQIAAAAEKAPVMDASTQLVFLTASRDTRYDAFSVLRTLG